MASGLDEDYEVVVIGNGPSGICMSYMLNGNWPYYNGQVHPDPILHSKLSEEPDKAIPERDLVYLSESLEGRSFNPLALLFDQLHHPNADLGLYEEPCLEWVHHNEHTMKHLVLGTGPPGGSWHYMQGSQLTLSLSNWLELPGWDYQSWMREHKSALSCRSCTMSNKPVSGGFERTMTGHIAQYYADYIDRMGLSDNFWSGVKVTSVKRLAPMKRFSLCDSDEDDDVPCSPSGRDGPNLWEVKGINLQNGKYCSSGESFTVHASNVVLAVGTEGNPRRLDIPGENLDFVHNHMWDVVNFVSSFEGASAKKRSRPVMVVGAGLTAADAVLLLTSRGIPVIHVFRRAAKDPYIILNKLPSSVYPDYCRVRKLMQGGVSENKTYTPYAKHRVVEIRDNHECLMQQIAGSFTTVSVSRVFVLIGCRPDLSFLNGINVKNFGIENNEEVDSKHNPVDVNPYTYESIHESGLYAVGPLAGDNFVRFGTGGALGVLSNLSKQTF